MRRSALTGSIAAAALVGVAFVLHIAWTPAGARRALDARGGQSRTERVAPGSAVHAAGSDKLPDGAVARLGSLRFRISAPISDFAVSPDGKLLAIAARGGDVVLMETGTGLLLSRPEIPSPAEAPVFSRDGRHVAVLCERRAREFDVATGHEEALQSPAGGRKVHSLVYVASEALLGITRPEKDSVGRSIWDLHAGKEVGRLPEPGSESQFVLSPDGRQALRAYRMGAYAIELWDVVENRRLAFCVPPGDASPLLAFDVAGRPVAVASHGARESQKDPQTQVAVVDVRDGAMLDGFTEPTATSCLGISGTADLMAYSVFVPHLRQTMPAAVSIRQLSTGQETFRIEAPRRFLGRAKFSEDRRIMVATVASSERPDDRSSQSLAVWDLRDRRRLDAPFEGHAAAVRSIAFGPRGEVLASASLDGTVRVWDVPGARERAVLTDAAINGRAVAFSPDGDLIAATTGGFYESEHSAVVVWDARSAKPAYRLPVAYISDSAAVAFSRDGRRLATGARLPRGGWTIEVDYNVRMNGGIEVWDHADLAQFPFIDDDNLFGWRMRDAAPASKFRKRGALSDDDDDVTGVALSPDGLVLATVGADVFGRGRLSFWKLPSGELVRRIQQGSHDDGWYVGEAAFSPDGKLLATTSSRNIHEAQWFRPDGEDSGLFGEARGKTIDLWNAADGTLVKTLRGHEGDLGGIVFSPDGRYLVSASLDTTVGIWRVVDGELLARVKGHTGGVLTVAFSPDGQLLASGSADTTILVWDFPRLLTRAGESGQR